MNTAGRICTTWKRKRNKGGTYKVLSKQALYTALYTTTLK